MALSSSFLCFGTKKRMKQPTVNFIRVSYNALSEATDNFSSDNLVGVGSFGSVYKVTLVTPSHGVLLVAVKVLNTSRWGASNTFMAECDMFRNIRHRNIVRIVTTCSSVDFRGNDFKALVYEFMANGSLEEWLHPKHGTQNMSKSLSLLQRLNIAIDVASALDYLHNHCKTPIVHCDLKPANILLDDKLSGRVSDFGLARFLSKWGTVVANQSSSRGSVGYIAPEYKKGGEASPYGDVYSFGIMLLEMFTGKKPSDHMFVDDMNLRTYVEMSLSRKVIEIADSRLLLQENDSQSEFCLRLIFDIGILSSGKSPEKRRNMGYVANELQRIRNVLRNKQRVAPSSSNIHRINPVRPPRDVGLSVSGDCSEWVKISTSGVWRRGSSANGYDGFFRNHQGPFIGAFYSSLDIPNATVAKMMAVIQAIEFAFIREWKYVWLEVDSKVVLDIVRKPKLAVPSLPPQLRALWTNCLYRISTMDFRCSLTGEERVYEPVALANFGATSTGLIWWDELPDPMFKVGFKIVKETSIVHHVRSIINFDTLPYTHIILVPSSFHVTCNVGYI